MHRTWRAVGAGLASAALVLSGSALAGPASAADPTTSPVTETTWQEVWSDVGHPGSLEKWRCYGHPRQFDRDPTWVIVWYRPLQTPECAGLPDDPYPWLVHKVDGVWRDAAMLGPVGCESLSAEVLAGGAPWGIVKDLMKDQWCDADSMWRGYMERSLNTRKCASPLTARINKSVVGYIGRSVGTQKITDGAVAWTCSRGAGGAQAQHLTVLLAGPVPKQITTALNMAQFESLKLRHNRVVVTGGLYSGTGPLCCPDLRVTTTFQMRGGTLVQLKEVITPIRDS